MTRLLSFVAALIRPKRAQRDLDSELTFHVESRMQDLIAEGHPPSEAARRARAELGDPARWQVDAREARGLRWLDELAVDVRIARRLATRNAAFTATAIVTLAVGIGATTAIFSELNAVLWRRLPVHNPEELRTLVWTSPQTGFLNTPAFQGPRLQGAETFASYSYPVYKAMRDASSGSFSDLACWMEPGELLPVVMGDLGFGAVQFVSGNYFRALGIQAARGRTLQPEDDIEGSPATVAVITHRFWRRAFGGDPDVLTRTLMLNGTPFAIIGVLPDGFFGLDPAITPDVMVPMAMLHIASAGGEGVLQTQANWSICRVFGRLRAAVADEQARAEAEAGALHSMTTTPNWPPKGRVYQLPKLWIVPADQGVEQLQTATKVPVLIALSAISLILLIACANIAGLLLARGTARQKEIATRMAIGASRARLVRQLLTESLLLAIAGGIRGGRARVRDDWPDAQPAQPVHDTDERDATRHRCRRDARSPRAQLRGSHQHAGGFRVWTAARDSIDAGQSHRANQARRSLYRRPQTRSSRWKSAGDRTGSALDDRARRRRTAYSHGRQSAERGPWLQRRWSALRAGRAEERWDASWAATVCHQETRSVAVPRFLKTW